MAQFAPDGIVNGGSTPGRIFDAHNAVWMIVDRMAGSASLLLRPVLRLEARRLKRYEAGLMSAFDRVLAVTEIDSQALMENAGHGTEEATPPAVIPIAVDTTELQPIRTDPASTSIVTLGTLHYPPNADGIRWFLQAVFPRIMQAVPAARLKIIGKNPPQDFLDLAAKQPDAVQVTGYVPDLNPYLEGAAVVVVPVRAGGGMRVRILEMFARGLPVVTTTVGLEGISAVPGTDVLVADTAEAFAEAVIDLLQEPGSREKLAEAGRRLVERRYDWQIVLADLEKVYRELEGQASADRFGG
jgi:glycosyltransferase involved in cell wall biosynthesis